MATPTPVPNLGIRVANAGSAAAYNQRVVNARAPMTPRYFTEHQTNTAVGAQIPLDEARETFRAYVHDAVNTSYPVESSSRLHTLLFGEPPCGVSLADAAPIRTAYAGLISAAVGSRGTSITQAAERYADAILGFTIQPLCPEALMAVYKTIFSIPKLWTGAAAVIRLDITRLYQRGPIILHDLSRIDFRDVPERDLRRANESGQIFSHAILDNSIFSGLNCAGFDFNGSACRKAQFVQTVLSGANFVGTHVGGTDFTTAIGGAEIPGRDPFEFFVE